MSTIQTSRQAGLRLAAGLAIAALAAVPTAFAQGSPAALANAEQMVVVRDAETGQLRAPTAAEVQALQQQVKAAPADASARAGLTRKMQPLVHSSGARGARLTPEMASYSVVVRQADGSLVEHCVDSRAAAETLVTQGAEAGAGAANPTK